MPNVSEYRSASKSVMRPTEEWCQRQELNLRPKAYESSALPLSYSGNRDKMIFRDAVRVKRNDDSNVSTVPGT
jgi:hypothetical protein